uniref:DUF305 domain-containing protein n=1 Tax=viral metagenome TaxID=1070528 RepID=A0A6C0F634_9ZZZZ|tara:strand:+ start:1886 stop:2470 length:585 start_codon:yes stop_codon:yes gene_type:complete
MNHSQHSDNVGSNPCTDKLSDLEYLEHMIPHHQVAVDMSVAHMPHTTNPQILHLCREIDRIQKYEIWIMERVKYQLIQTVFSDESSERKPVYTKLDMYSPKMSKDRDGECDPLFFKPDEHAHHMKSMKMTDKSYLEHMIPHHQVAIDMSQRLLRHTENSFLMDFCNKLIYDQQGEIFKMKNMLQNKYDYHSQLI